MFSGQSDAGGVVVMSGKRTAPPGRLKSLSGRLFGAADGLSSGAFGSDGPVGEESIVAQYKESWRHVAPEPVPAELSLWIESVGRSVGRSGSYRRERGDRARPNATFQYTIDGMGWLSVGGETWCVPPGHAMLVSSRDDFVYHAGEEGWYSLWVSLVGESAFKIWRGLTRTAGHVIKLESDSLPVRALERVFERAQRNEYVDSWSNAEDALALCAALGRQVQRPLRSSECDRFSAPVQRAIDCCNEQLSEPLTLDDLAAVAGLSRSHFSRLFRTETGISPWQFLIQARVRKGAELLRSTSKRVNVVSEVCGFPDPNHFCRLFRKHFGSSPGAFRKWG